MYLLYAQIQQILEIEFGPDVVLLMQVGDFYEVYIIEPVQNLEFESLDHIVAESQNNDQHYQQNSRSFLGVHPKVIELLGLNQSERHICKSIPKSLGVSWTQGISLMSGFPPCSLYQFLDILLGDGRTVVEIAQTTDEKFEQKLQNNHAMPEYEKTILSLLNVRDTKGILTKKHRIIRQIHSPGTTIDTNSRKSNDLMCIYLQYVRGEPSIAIATVNLTSGSSTLYEITNTRSNSRFAIDNTRSNSRFAIDEALRYIQTINPVETIIATKNISKTAPIFQQLELDVDNLPPHRNYIDNIKDQYFQPEYQRALISRVFSTPDHINQLNHCRIWQRPNCLVAYCILLQFVYGCNPNLLKDLSVPVYWSNKSHLTLTNNALYQLNLVGYNQQEIDPRKNQTHGSESSKRTANILNFIDYTQTGPGYRLQKYRLLNPIQDSNEINRRLSITRAFTASKIPAEPIQKTSEPIGSAIRHYLYHASDLEQLHRLLTLGELAPKAFNKLDRTYQALERILSLFERLDEPTLNQLVPYPEFSQDLTKFRQAYLSRLDLEKTVSQSNHMKLTDSFFQPGNYPELDEISQAMYNNNEKIQKIAQAFIAIINKKESGATLKTQVKDDTTYLVLTPTRWETLNKNFPKDGIKLQESFTVKLSDLKVLKRAQANNILITCPLMQQIDTDQSQLSESMITKLAPVYQAFLSEMTTRARGKTSNDFFFHVNRFLAELDFHQSQAYLKLHRNYCFPEALSHEVDYHLEVEQLRHPIAEALQNTRAYVPHDLTIGEVSSRSDEAKPSLGLGAGEALRCPKDSDESLGAGEALRCPKDSDESLGAGGHRGLLIYGPNGSGKSLIMKSLGTAVIMAQAGMVVAAKSLKFRPYNQIITRILGNDNLHKGQSSFTVEIMEIYPIAIGPEPGSLILGDEISHGTENQSGTALSAATIRISIDSGCHFIFTSHLHDLPTVPILTAAVESNQLGVYHLSDPINRRLEPGSGDSLYGLEVARDLGLPSKFIELAQSTRRHLLGISTDLQPAKTSIYNKSVYFPPLCPVCQQRAPTETHHISPQRNADADGFIGHMHKNHPSNLIPLCSRCHKQTENPTDGQLLVVDSPTTWHYEIQEKQPSPIFRRRLE